MAAILIVKLGSTFPELAAREGDFEDWVAERLGLPADQIHVLDPVAGDPFPYPENFSGVVLTGSHAMVTDRLPWSERTAAWLPEVVEAGVPLLGICYGHQLLAHAFGGRVGANPRGPELGTATIRLRPTAVHDPLLGSMQRSTFPAQVSHEQSVLQPPAGAVILASNPHEPCHAYALGTSAWGVQFHPEFSPAVTTAYIDAAADGLRARCQDAAALRTSVRETPLATSLLGHFAALCLSPVLVKTNRS